MSSADEGASQAGMVRQVVPLIAAVSGYAVEQITPSLLLEGDLMMDSLSLTALQCEIEAEFDLECDLAALAEAKSVGDVAQVVIDAQSA